MYRDVSVFFSQILPATIGMHIFWWIKTCLDVTKKVITLEQFIAKAVQI